jgi:lipopolysaccharide export LptBFGC system permease protein LptF
MTRRPRAPGAWLKQGAEQVFDHVTLETVVLPALADLGHECTLPSNSRLSKALVTLRAYSAIWKVLGFCGTRMLLRDSAYAFSIVSRRIAITWAVITLALTLPPLIHEVPRVAPRVNLATLVEIVLLLVPQALAISLPVAYFLGLVVSVRAASLPDRRRLCSGVILGSVVCGMLMFALTMFVMPWANQAYRTVLSNALNVTVRFTPPGGPPKGLSEMNWTELNDAIANPASAHHFVVTRAHLHVRLALCAAPLVFGLLALGIAGRWRSRLATVGAAISILLLYGVLFGLGAKAARDVDPVFLGPWVANLIVGILAVALLYLPRSRAVQAQHNG